MNFGYEVTLRVTCSVCGRVSDAETHHISVGATPPFPLLPEGWHTLDGRAICDRHEVRVVGSEDSIGELRSKFFNWALSQGYAPQTAAETLRAAEAFGLKEFFKGIEDTKLGDPK